MGDVLLGARDEVVDRDDRATAGDEHIDQVGRDEAGASCHKDAMTGSEALGNHHEPKTTDEADLPSGPGCP
ncbi:hypothetical protein Asi02nite_05880 [Asanoa siamensis]|uniref:Uncharacterized protein n=1 Tax=Asanoa siamensis TaxID=926357 RepID=A0ABQ4CIF1_9ACTN|nr:hypothetical protein Asi02nite_05880 [Asanoa siamensis]